MIKYFLTIFFFIGVSFSYAQDITFDKVKQQYEKFAYDNVIKYSDQLIEKGDLNDSLSIELHLMRANIFYTYGADSSTRKSFENILKIKKNFIPDPDITSPILISIFNEVKADYLRKNPDISQISDSTNQQKQQELLNPNPQRIAVIKNILVPGLGQIHNGYSTKGWITTSASAINLGALIYFAVDANSKQNNYLTEKNKALIQQKYDDYNSSYKIRNTLIISYVAIWLYSQIDFLFFSETKQQIDGDPINSFFNLSPAVNEITLNVKFSF